ncbi:hypothetical protein, partial [Paraburkholderia hospita]|uniref:hypothetical protein n=1 Tax=Paraburkholderia hospita TaxID=169430 RepID=UPI001A9A187D
MKHEGNARMPAQKQKDQTACAAHTISRMPSQRQTHKAQRSRHESAPRDTRTKAKRPTACAAKTPKTNP